MERKTVSHERPGGSLSVTVAEADVLMGMRHTMLICEAHTFTRRQRAKDQTEEEPQDQMQEGVAAIDGPEDPLLLPEDEELALFLLRRYAWPNCKAATVASSGFDHATLTFEEFCKLPEVFVGQWEQAVLDLNPHWKLALRETKEEAEAEKKSNSASESE